MAKPYQPKAGAPVGDRRYAANRPASAKNDSRSKLIIAVRAACRRKGIDDGDRRDLQLELTGKGSLADMSLAEIGKVLDHCNRDWSPDSNRSGARPHVGKIRALWWSLYWLGVVDAPNDEALTAFVKRQTGVEHLRFLDHMKAPPVIEALKDMCTRAGVRWFRPEEIAAHNSPLFTANADRHAVLRAIGNRLEKLGYVDKRTTFMGWVSATLKIDRATMAMTSTELDAAIRLFGKKLRRAAEAGS